MHALIEKANLAKDKKAQLGKDIDLSYYNAETPKESYVDQLNSIDKTDSEQFLKVGVDLKNDARLGTFIQRNHSVIHCKSSQDGVELMGISDALAKYDWLDKYLWNKVQVDTDKYTAQVQLKPSEGYFIRINKGVKAEYPVQTCLYIAKDKLSQNVHNIVIAEEDSDLKIITGCSTSPHITKGLHVGVSEIYVKKGAKLTFTMIHDWGKAIDVRPRTAVYVEEGGVFISNYICLRPAGTLQMYPVTYLEGRGAIARFNSVLVASESSHLDIGSKVVLNAPETRAEIISRAITTGGTIIARGNLVGKVPGVKAHLECKGLILKPGLMHAIPEIEGYVPGVEMSHEAAVGKINPEQIEYLMARGLNEEEAVSTIVRGFLNVDIEGLPESLKESLDKTIAETQKDMF